MDDTVMIRAALPADTGTISDIYRPYVTDSVISFEHEPPDRDEILRRMSASPRLPWLVAGRSAEVVGYCYAAQHRSRAAYRWSVDVSVYLSRPEHGRGTGRALYRELLERLRQLGYVAAFAGITLPNERSVRLHESMGFTSVGVFRSAGFKDGRWHDVGWWQRTLPDELPSLPLEPRRWSPPS